MCVTNDVFRCVGSFVIDTCLTINKTHEIRIALLCMLINGEGSLIDILLNRLFQLQALVIYDVFAPIAHSLAW